MTDAIQRSSTIPLPAYQTGQDAKDPVPVSSPRALDRSSAARADDDALADAGAFKDYLDRTSVTVVEKAKPKHQMDAADMVAQGGVYGMPKGPGAP